MPAAERAEGLDPGQPAAGDGFAGILGELTLAVGQLREQMRPGTFKPRIPWEACHPVQFVGQIPVTAGAGTLRQGDLYGPKDPYWWDLRSLEVWGFTAGTVTVFRNDVNGEQVGVAPTAGELNWSAQKFLAPRDQLIFVASGITGTVTISGWAIEVEAEWLPDYLV